MHQRAGPYVTRHAGALALIGLKSRRTKGAKNALDDLERRHQGHLTIPEAVRVWYEDPRGVELLRTYSNEDTALTIPKLTPATWVHADVPTRPLDVLEFL